MTSDAKSISGSFSYKKGDAIFQVILNSNQFRVEFALRNFKDTGWRIFKIDSKKPNYYFVLYPDYSTPEKAIIAYWSSIADQNSVVFNSFYPPINFRISGKYWNSYEIIEKKNSKIRGEKTSKGLLINDKAVEIIIREYTPDAYSKTTDYWYLLQPIQGEWKIISHSSLDDYDNFDNID